MKAGDYSYCNEAWPADSTIGIIPHWRDELKLDMNRFQYWSMDNEMDIWMGTHKDLPLDIDPDVLVNRYIDVAHKARAVWKDVKLTGPVVANEWQWCSVSSSEGKSGLGVGEDRNYCWLEYFIKRLSEEQKKTGVRMLDVFDIHWYPTEKTYEERVNWHRVFFDTTYNYSGANGIKLVNGSWDNNNTKPYIFKRVNDWLEKYFGKDHGITLGVTETSLIEDSDPMTTAITYASWLGTFMDNSVEIFTPWSWGKGMYEVVHLFSRYGHENRVLSQSTNDSLVSAYSSINNKGDSLTVILVNRAENTAQNVALNVAGFEAVDGEAPTWTLSGITGETFVSHTENALKSAATSVAGGKLNLNLPAKSITAVQLYSKNPTEGIKNLPTIGNVHIAVQGKDIFVSGVEQRTPYALSNVLGQVITRGVAQGNIFISAPVAGSYILRLGKATHKVTIQ